MGRRAIRSTGPGPRRRAAGSLRCRREVAISRFRILGFVAPVLIVVLNAVPVGAGVDSVVANPTLGHVGDSVVVIVTGNWVVTEWSGNPRAHFWTGVGNNYIDMGACAKEQGVTGGPGAFVCSFNVPAVSSGVRLIAVAVSVDPLSNSLTTEFEVLGAGATTTIASTTTTPAPTTTIVPSATSLPTPTSTPGSTMGPLGTNPSEVELTAASNPADVGEGQPWSAWITGGLVGLLLGSVGMVAAVRKGFLKV